MLIRLFFRLYLFIFGMTFRETEIPATAVEFHSVRTGDNHGGLVSFTFFRDVPRQLKFHWGILRTIYIPTYYVKASFDGRLSDMVVRYNTIRIGVDGRYFANISDDVVARLLMELYLDYMNAQIVKLI